MNSFLSSHPKLLLVIMHKAEFNAWTLGAVALNDINSPRSQDSFSLYKISIANSVRDMEYSTTAINKSSESYIRGASGISRWDLEK